ncbi:MAG: hypothetical protein H0V24_15560 [Chloroflexia bacterium]|nr:hypothetical protein [Chloroflexia bacterium]
MSRPPVLYERDIELQASEVLEAYERLSGSPIGLPVPIERIAHQVLDLPVVWEPLDSLPGKEVVSKYKHAGFGKPAYIALNERLINTSFEQYRGLENTAIAHETGHGIFTPNAVVSVSSISA